MRSLLTAILSTSLTLQAQSIHQVSAANLEQYLDSAEHTPDADVANHLSVMELTERLTSARLTTLETRCPGKECRHELLALVDQSAFLEAPASESSSNDAPSLEEQKQITARFLTFVGLLNRQMPNFIATRTTTRFEDWPKGLQIGPEVAGRTIPLGFAGQTHTTITYRDGQEITAKEKTTSKSRQKTGDQGLLARGLFGPMLTTIILDASKSELTWSRWQQNGTERLAVFRFVVPMEKSTYDVKFCCVPISNGLLGLLDRMTAYHGELAVNPEDGVIANITLMADLEKGDLSTLLQEAAEGQPLLTADLAVEYGPVEIGGNYYTCPVKAVALSRARTLMNRRLGLVRTYLDDISFTGYQVFRSESRILTNY